MYDVALTVAACLRSGTRVDVAWVVDSELRGAGGQPPDATGALALTPGGGRVGSLLNGVLDDQLAEHAAIGGSGRLLTLTVSDLEAQAVGLAGGGTARCLLIPASDLPEDLWPLLDDRAPVRLLARLDGDRVIGTALLAVGEIPVDDHDVVTELSPVATLVLAGRGPVLDALAAFATVLGWRIHQAPNPAAANGLVVGLGPLDNVVLAMHDDDMAGSVLSAALSGRAGYIAALGSRAKQQAREQWLVDRGVTGLERIHTPAGLDIGADGPAEVAIAILAEAIAVRSS